MDVLQMTALLGESSFGGGFAIGIAVGMGSGIAVGIGNGVASVKKRLGSRLDEAIAAGEIRISDKAGAALTSSAIVDLIQEKDCKRK